MTPKITAIDHLVLTVTEIRRTLDFYHKVLGMRAETFLSGDGTTRVALKFGSQKINLHLAGAEFDPKSRTPTAGSADLCFLSELPVADWARHLAENNVRIEEGPVERTGATGPLVSIYIRDPDGNLVEISNKI